MPANIRQRHTSDGWITNGRNRVIGVQTASSGETFFAGEPVAVTYVPSGTSVIQVDSVADVYYATAATGATTWEFSGPFRPGVVTAFTLELTNGGSQVQTWPTSVKWAGGTAPTLTAAGVDILTFYTRDGGTIWRGFASALDSK